MAARCPFKFVKDLISKAESSGFAESRFGVSGVLSVEFNGGLPLFFIESPDLNDGVGFEPTTSQIIEVLEGVF